MSLAKYYKQLRFYVDELNEFADNEGIYLDYFDGMKDLIAECENRDCVEKTCNVDLSECETLEDVHRIVCKEQYGPDDMTWQEAYVHMQAGGKVKRDEWCQGRFIQIGLGGKIVCELGHAYYPLEFGRWVKVDEKDVLNKKWEDYY